MAKTKKSTKKSGISFEDNRELMIEVVKLLQIVAFIYLGGTEVKKGIDYYAELRQPGNGHTYTQVMPGQLENCQIEGSHIYIKNDITYQTTTHSQDGADLLKK